MKNGPKQKSKIRQYLCKHNKMYWHEEKGTFEGRLGIISYSACKNCGKVFGIYFNEE